MRKGNWVRVKAGAHTGERGIVEKVNRTAVRIALSGKNIVCVPSQNLEVIPQPRSSAGWDSR